MKGQEKSSVGEGMGDRGTEQEESCRASLTFQLRKGGKRGEGVMNSRGREEGVGFETSEARTKPKNRGPAMGICTKSDFIDRSERGSFSYENIGRKRLLLITAPGSTIDRDSSEGGDYGTVASDTYIKDGIEGGLFQNRKKKRSLEAILVKERGSELGRAQKDGASNQEGILLLIYN